MGWGGAEAVAAYVVGINRYKAVYDVFGFAAGNDGLRQYGLRIVEWAGPSALVTRLSDDVFAVVRPEQVGACDTVAGVQAVAGAAPCK